MIEKRFVRLIPAIENVTLVYTVLLVAAYVLIGTTVLDGNVHDFFLPINAAYAMQLGGIGQDALRSPFGPLYAVLSANSLALIEAWPGWIQLDKIHALSSLQFLILPIFLFFAYRALQEDDRRFPKWLLLVAMIVCVLPRSADAILTLFPNWYGTYNNHLWSILLLQAANLYAWRGRRPDGRKLLLIAVLDAICVMVSFNYKFSFFVPAMLLVLLSAACLGGWKQRFTYMATIVVLVCVITGLVSAAGYSYSAYFRELQWLLAAKSLQVPPLRNHVFLLLAFVALSDLTRPGDAAGHARLTAIPVISYEGLRYVTIRFGFSAVVGCAVLLAAQGDFHSPAWPYIVLLALASSSGGDQSLAAISVYSRLQAKLRFFASACVVVLLVTGLVSLAFLIRPQATLGDGPLEALHLRSIAVDPLRFEYGQSNPSASFDELVEVGLSAGPPTPEKLIRMSYSVTAAIRIPPQLSAVIDLIKAQYPADLGLTAQWFSRRLKTFPPETRVVIGFVGFVNPLPFLTGNLFPKDSLHWMHLHTTIGEDQIYPALEPMATADAVVVPALYLPLIDQKMLNCSFYLWNMRQGEIFVLQEVSGLNLVFLRKGGRLQPDPHPPYRLDYNEIERVCRR
jgi:hypothetical protein